MMLRALNTVLPILSNAEKYGLELKGLQKRKARIEKRITDLHAEAVYLECRIRGLTDTIDTIKGEAEDTDPVDNTPTLGG